MYNTQSKKEITMFDFDVSMLEEEFLQESTTTLVTEQNISDMEDLYAPWQVYATADPAVRKAHFFAELDALSVIMPEFSAHMRKQFIDVGVFKLTSDNTAAMQRDYGSSSHTYIRSIYMHSEETEDYKFFSLQMPPVKDLSAFPLLQQYPDYEKELSKIYTEFFNGFVDYNTHMVPIYQMEQSDVENHEILDFEPFYDYYEQNKSKIDLSKIVSIGNNGGSIYFYLNFNWPAEDGNIDVMMVDVRGDKPYERYEFWDFMDFMSVIMHDGKGF